VVEIYRILLYLTEPILAVHCTRLCAMCFVLLWCADCVWTI